MIRNFITGQAISFRKRSPLPKWAGPVFRAAKLRAARKNLSYTLSDTDIGKIVARANGMCEVTGIPFCFRRVCNEHKRPFVPSLDRIDSKHGYDFINVRLTVAIVNNAISEYNDDVFWTMVAEASKLMNKTIDVTYNLMSCEDNDPELENTDE